MGTIVGAVTGGLIEFADGTYDVPDVLRGRIEGRLERELADDYDPKEEEGEEEDGEWPPYEKRVRRKKRKKVGVSPTKASGAGVEGTKKKDEDEGSSKNGAGRRAGKRTAAHKDAEKKAGAGSEKGKTTSAKKKKAIVLVSPTQSR